MLYIVMFDKILLSILKLGAYMMIILQSWLNSSTDWGGFLKEKEEHIGKDFVMNYLFSVWLIKMKIHHYFG